MKSLMDAITGGATAIVLLTASNAFAINPCDTDPASKVAAETLKSMYEPEHLIGSCAIPKFSRKEDWRDGLDNDVSAFLNKDHSKTVDEAVKKEGLQNSIDFLLNGDYQKQGLALNLQKSEQDKVDYWKGLKESKTSIAANRGDADMLKNEHNLFKVPLLRVTKEKLESSRNEWIKTYTQDFQAKLAGDADLKMRVAAAAKQKDCVSGVDFDLQPEKGMRTERLDSKITEKEAIALLDSKVKDLQKTGANGSSSVYACSPPLLMRSDLDPAPIEENIDLTAASFFADNEKTLSPDQLKSLQDRISEKLKSDDPNCVRELKSVQIETSASKLANTGNLKPWDFAGLSQGRADHLKLKVNEYVAEHKVKLSEPELKIAIDAKGKTGDGTSGVCPYIVDSKPSASGKFKIMPDPAVDLKSLAENRYGKIHLEIVQKGPKCIAVQPKNTRDQVYEASKCFQVKISCK